MNRNFHIHQLFPLLFFTFFIFFFLIYTGTITSGFHLTDDHEIIRINEELESNSLLLTISSWLKKDFNIRFRPVYYIHRIIQVSLFGSNFLYWKVYTGFLFIISSLLFYYGLKKLGFDLTEIIIFYFLTFCGKQMSIWWRLGPSETLGVFFLSISFFLIGSNNGKVNNILFTFFLILSSLCKESFTIIIPAFVFLRLLFANNYSITEFSDLTLLIKKNNIVLILPLIIFVINILVIVLLVGTEKIGYAGVSMSITSLLKGIFSIIKTTFKELILIYFIFLISIYFQIKDEKKFFIFFKPMIKYMIFSFLIIIPSVIIYSKSGISGRYLIPIMIGISFLFINLLREVKVRYHWLWTVFIFLLALYSLNQFRFAYQDAVDFAKEGLTTNELISSIVKHSKNNEKFILIVDPAYSYEWSISLDYYLSIQENIYLGFMPYSKKEYNDFEESLSKSWNDRYKNRITDDFKNIDYIIFLDNNIIDEELQTRLELKDNYIFNSDFLSFYEMKINIDS